MMVSFRLALNYHTGSFSSQIAASRPSDREAVTPPPSPVSRKKIRRVISAVEPPQGWGDPLPAPRQRHTLALPKCPVPLPKAETKRLWTRVNTIIAGIFRWGVYRVRPISGGETGPAQPDQM